MTRSVFSLIVMLAVSPLLAAPASAAVIVFDECAPAATCGNSSGYAVIDLDARGDGTGLPGGPVNVQVNFGQLFGPGAFGFNIAGSQAGLTISNLTPGFSFGGTNESIGPFGTFEYIIDGPPQGTYFPVLRFTIGRDDGFLDADAVLEVNTAGYLAGGTRFDFFDPSNTFTIGASQTLDLAPVPEPGTMMLLATGLAAAWRARRRLQP